MKFLIGDADLLGDKLLRRAGSPLQGCAEILTRGASLALAGDGKASTVRRNHGAGTEHRAHEAGSDAFHRVPIFSPEVENDTESVPASFLGKLRAGQCARTTGRLLLVMALLGFSCPRIVPGEPGSVIHRTGFVYSDIYLQHHTGAGHPERPERLTAIVERLKQKGLLSELVQLKPVAAAPEWITTIHSPEYVERVKSSCRAGTGYVDTPDAPASTNSYDVALMAAGGVLCAIDAVMEGKIENAFCAVRPPGHHALKDRAMGFCLFNNIAIAAKYVQQKQKLAKVLIVDWDVHHGNGTQAAFYSDPTVFYFSTHQSPFYPGTGGAEERGAGKGVGFTLNVPLPAGRGDAEYKKAFEEQLKPAADAFKPDFVLISAGFDAAKDDLLGRMKITPEGYAALTRIVKGIAMKHCHGRLVSVLEGGYNLEALAASVEAHVRVLME